MTNILEISKKLSEKISNVETQKSSRTADDRQSFLYAMEYILTDIWKKYYTHPDNNPSLQKNKNYYSLLEKYRDKKLTYFMVKQAFDGLIGLQLIYVTKEDYYDFIKMEGSLTRYSAREELIEMLKEIPDHPSSQIKPNLDDETILLSNIVNSQKNLVDYEDDAFTDKARKNLKIINKCFSKHWFDLKIKDEDETELQERLLFDNEKEPIDLTKRTLVRIFINNSFEEDGKFYRGWWQNVPSEYRPFITINSKLTAEYDFSQLNPNIIYNRYNHELGSVDAYDRVLDGEHRKIVKQAFNAMMQAKSDLGQKPKKINLDEIGMSWKELKEAILKAHKPIKDLFFTGLGNRLQFENSQITENVMLQFVKLYVPVLPIDDSFIMHHEYAAYGELEEAIRRSYHDRFHSNIKVIGDIVVQIKSKKVVSIDNTSSDSILKAESDYSQWIYRDKIWVNGK
jgi:hypothetical protein